MLSLSRTNRNRFSRRRKENNSGTCRSIHVRSAALDPSSAGSSTANSMPYVRLGMPTAIRQPRVEGDRMTPAEEARLAELSCGRVTCGSCKTRVESGIRRKILGSTATALVGCCIDLVAFSVTLISRINGFLWSYSCKPNGRRRALVVTLTGSTEHAKTQKTCLDRDSNLQVRTGWKPLPMVLRPLSTNRGVGHASL